MQIKKVFNLEETLTSDEFISNKQDSISDKYQLRYPNMLCKVYTYCVEDKKFVIHTTEDRATSVGASGKLLGHNPIDDQSLLTLDNEMTGTWEIVIASDTDISDYTTALDVAQAKADEMMEADKSKMPIVTVIDYRWGNPVTQIVPTIFGETDEDGNLVPPSQPTPVFAIGDVNKGKEELSVRDYPHESLVLPYTDDIYQHIGNYGTIDIVARVSDFSKASRLLATHESGVGYGFYVSVETDGTVSLSFGYDGDSNYPPINTNLVINENEVFNVKITKDGGNFKIFVNDSLEAAENRNAQMHVNATPFNVGGFYNESEVPDNFEVLYARVVDGEILYTDGGDMRVKQVESPMFEYGTLLN